MKTHKENENKKKQKDAEVIPGGIATYDITVTRISGSFPTISLDLEDMSGSWDPAIKYWFEPSSETLSFSSKLNIATTSAGGVYGFKIDFKEDGHDSPFASEYITLRVGGEIKVESEVGKGSTFSFVIPKDDERE